jgi:hypothetical protein
MRNRFHLVVETPNANLVAGMRWLLSPYSFRLNNRRKETGHVFSGCYKALLVDGSGSGYLKTVCDYVHLNPVRAKLLQAEVAGASQKAFPGTDDQSSRFWREGVVTQAGTIQLGVDEGFHLSRA